MKWNRNGKDGWRQMRGASSGKDGGGRKVKEGGNGNKISGTRAIDERERERDRE